MEDDQEEEVDDQENDEEEGVEVDGGDEDNSILGDANRRGNLVTRPEHQTEAVHHAGDPELMEDGDSAADKRSLLSILSVISVALLANHFFA